MIASMVGFEDHGIEIDAWLVEVAEGLIQEPGLAVDVICVRFGPEGGELNDSAFEENHGSISMVTESVNMYFELGLEIDEVDIVLCFP